MKTKQSIDINCDLGESINPQQWEADSHLMPYISSCNIACGGHAGNQESIKVTIANAIHNQLKIGAHPSYPDKDNFGRVTMKISEQELRQTLRQQIEAIAEECQRQNTDLHHIKPHGALYNDSTANKELAYIIADEVKNFNANIKLMGLAQSNLFTVAQELSLNFLHEGFMDRNYHANTHLVPRGHTQAMHKSLEESLSQALKLAKGEAISSIEGIPLTLKVDTICLHGDNPNAKDIAQRLYQLLREHDIEIS
ncbi:5-oxoprolinase subunit PxpA [Kangiella koreensis]|uniref:LamB/YcsF family protein n=1 Tax=Kangiella koreensis (strain DSM 16069 / JCM 12317 / KCTC 12182 / SW-125) TaxID=523791 RepID=C7R8W9_KANKD|nr:5-oxoprolinase subunit PxpA [Kangiella koreensis]ACV25982.1 LamB/YcsF family protein [Kangiella koreensis DSM 16069]